MKKSTLLAFIAAVALAIALPISASASSVSFTSSGGTIWIGSSGLSTSSSSGFTSPSQIGQIHNLGGQSFNGANLGSLTFSTGALTSGTLGSNATFAGGGSLSLALNGSIQSLPSAVVFNGTFSGPVTMTQMANGSFTLTGTVSGMLGGKLVNGTATLLTGPMRNGQLSINSANVNIALPVPEPGTLSLLGTGLLGLAGLVRRKRRVCQTART